MTVELSQGYRLSQVGRFDRVGIISLQQSGSDSHLFEFSGPLKFLPNENSCRP